MPIDITGEFQPSDGVHGFDLYDPQDIKAGNVNVILQAVAAGAFKGGSHATAPVGEVVIQVKTTTGAPTHSASEGTLCWNSVDDVLYANNNGTTGWTAITGGGGGGGDSITVNGVAVVDADLDDATPAAPANAQNVKWQKDASSPANVSAYVDKGVANSLATLDAGSKVPAAQVSEVLALADLSDVTAKSGAGTVVLMQKAPTLNDENNVAALTVASGGFSPVNSFRFRNQDTGQVPYIEAVGTDANIDIGLTPKGTGGVKVLAGHLRLESAKQVNWNVSGTPYIAASTDSLNLNCSGTALGTINLTPGSSGSVKPTRLAPQGTGGAGHFLKQSALDGNVSSGVPVSTDVSDFTEAVQDAVGVMVDGSLTYVDATPLLQRAALTGDVTAAAGSNVTTIAAMTSAALAGKIIDETGSGVLVFGTSPIFTTSATLAADGKLILRDANQFIQSSVLGQLDIRVDLTGLIVIGPSTGSGDIDLGDSTLRVMRPQTDLKIDLGSASFRFNDAYMNRLFAGSITATQATLGNEVARLESTATNDDPSERVFQNRAATTDATVTTLHTVAIAANTTYQIEADVIARRTGGAGGTADDGASYKIIATYKTAAGTVTLIGSVTTLYSAESVAGYDATLTISGTNVLVRVTGVASTNITWHCTVRVRQVGT